MQENVIMNCAFIITKKFICVCFLWIILSYAYTTRYPPYTLHYIPIILENFFLIQNNYQFNQVPLNWWHLITQLSKRRSKEDMIQLFKIRSGRNCANCFKPLSFWNLHSHVVTDNLVQLKASYATRESSLGNLSFHNCIPNEM